MEETEVVESPSEEEKGLDAVRVRMLAARKRAVGKTQGYWLLGTLFLLIGGVIVSAQGIATLWSGRWVMGSGLMLLAIGLLYFGLQAAAKVRRLETELRKSELESIATMPDFTGLGDGSGRWKRMEEIR